MPTVNEALADAAVSHSVDLQRYGNGVVRRIIGILNRVDADLFAQIIMALDRLPAESFSIDRLEALLGSVRSLNLQAYQQVERELTTELKSLAEYEAGYQQQLFTSTIPAQIQVRLAIAPVNVQQVFSAAYAQPFRGRLLREWASSIEADRMVRIRDAIRLGYVENQPIGQIVQRLRGTRAKGYSDGIIEIDRRNAETIVRTAVSHVAAHTRDSFMRGNGDLLKAIQWVSTLDARTSNLCIVRDGLRYTPETHQPIGHSVPWLAGPGLLHFNCRSVGVPITKSWRELGIPIDEMSPGTRASMDGQVPEDQTYGQWLAKQSAGRQDEILGPTRGKLLREGGLTVDKFSNDKGVWRSLEQLRATDAKAFARAGL